MAVVLVTGLSGQDGRLLAERLVQDTWTVHGTISAESVEDSGFSEVATHRLDLTHHDETSALVRDLEPDVIFNLAGISSVARSWQEPAATIAVNAVGAATLLEAAWQLSIKARRSVKFVQASSAEIFGRADDVPQNEKTQVRPVSPYGASKALAHQLVGVYREKGLFASSAILYNHESPLRPEAFVTRKITKQVARISLGYDETLRLGSLEAKRDWGWAPDYVDAMLRMAKHSRPDDFVIASGASHSIAEFVAQAFAVVGIDDWKNYVQMDDQFARPVNPGEMQGDASKARRELGWAPSLTFEQIVQRMVQHDINMQRSQMSLEKNEASPA
ncbi:GDP-mannose 4,6-dehydratase [Pseudarthrobacter sp. B4EP4b]|uniref:GDP-mannose 4,6-dehydratase n=1 Tax=Pseudarthrobacter sp. B4EP4b TaxID=2590664 RepID=UPI00114EB326|nr:GDP-mannose 4,6-dehydratase [Pseudarthrobacter sp. B4EP4b]